MDRLGRHAGMHFVRALCLYMYTLETYAFVYILNYYWFSSSVYNRIQLFYLCFFCAGNRCRPTPNKKCCYLNGTLSSNNI